jgi:hypothetical protein
MRYDVAWSVVMQDGRRGEPERDALVDLPALYSIRALNARHLTTTTNLQRVTTPPI